MGLFFFYMPVWVAFFHLMLGMVPIDFVFMSMFVKVFFGGVLVNFFVLVVTFNFRLVIAGMHSIRRGSK